MFSLFSSDIFITLRYTVFILSLDQLIGFHLRVYAITFRNKILAVYFGTLALARLAVSLASSFARPVAFVDLPPIPIDAFNFCPVLPNLQFRLVPNALGTVFGKWVAQLAEIAERGIFLRTICIPGHCLVRVPKYDDAQDFSGDSHDRRGSYDIFHRYGGPADIYPIVLRSHGGTVPLPPSAFYLMVANPTTPGYQPTSFRSVSINTTNLNDGSSQLTVSHVHNPVRMRCKFTLSTPQLMAEFTSFAASTRYSPCGSRSR